MNIFVFSVLWIIVFTFFLQILKFIYDHLYLRKKLSVIPGPKTTPFIGSFPDMSKVSAIDEFTYTVEHCLKYKNGIIVIWKGLLPTVYLRKPRHMAVILQSQEYIVKPKLYDQLSVWLGKGLITSTGDVWHRHRRLITPSFKYAVLHEFVDLIWDKIDILKDCIRSEIERNPKGPINVFPLAKKFTLDTVCQTVMGIDMATQKTGGHEYVETARKFLMIQMYRYLHYFASIDIIFNLTKISKVYYKAAEILHKFTDKVIQEKILVRKANTQRKKETNNEDDVIGKQKAKALLDLLMDITDGNQYAFTLKELREEVDTFLFAGHDTTALALVWSLFALGNEPKIQDKIVEELDEVFGNDTKPASKEQLSKLKYLERFIKEVLRVYPSVPLVSRLLHKEVVIDKYLIPKGTQVNVCIYQAHHDPEVWENPEKFDPDRFLPENIKSRDPYAYIPFSAGPRNCIAQKLALMVLKCTIAGILREWIVTSELKPSEMKLVTEIILVPPNGTMNVYFTPRNKKLIM